MTEQAVLVWEGGTVVGVEPVVDMGLTIVESPKDFGDGADVVFHTSGESAVAALYSLRRGEGMKVLIQPGQARSA